MNIFTVYYKNEHNRLILDFANIVYKFQEINPDILLIDTDYWWDTNTIEKEISKVLPKIIIFHCANHYSEHMSWRQYFESTKIDKKFPQLKFIVLEHDLGKKLISTDNYKEIHYEFLYEYFSKLIQHKTLSTYLFAWNSHATNINNWVKPSTEDINNIEREKIFLSPNRLYLDQKRTKYRRKLFEFLFNNKKNCGFISGPGRKEKPELIKKLINWDGENLFLPCQYEGKNFELVPAEAGYSGGGSPIHEYYYNSSYLSIYTESIEISNEIAPTEKTYFPLWKGHLILPFSSPHFVRSLETCGFKMPKKYINYDYDNILDNEKRWAEYFKELNRLLDMKISDWDQIFLDTYDIRKFNSDKFYIEGMTPGSIHLNNELNSKDI